MTTSEPAGTAVPAREILPLLQEWARLQTAMAPPLETFEALTGAMPDCPLLAPVYEVWTAYTRLISEKVGDRAEWLSYFEHDCKMGAEPREVTWTCPDGTMEAVQLDSLEKLAYLLIS